MRKVIMDLAVTLDGYIEGPNGEVDWCIVDDGGDSSPENHFTEFLSGVDTIFYGRISYDLWGNYQPGDASPMWQRIYNIVHTKKKYVFSKTKSPDETDTVFVQGDVRERVLEILREPGKDIWLYGGSKLITTFLNENLVNVVRLAVHPVVLGAGKPLFQDIQNRKEMKFLEAKTSASGVVVLVYELK